MTPDNLKISVKYIPGCQQVNRGRCGNRAPWTGSGGSELHEKGKAFQLTDDQAAPVKKT